MFFMSVNFGIGGTLLLYIMLHPGLVDFDMCFLLSYGTFLGIVHALLYFPNWSFSHFYFVWYTV